MHTTRTLFLAGVAAVTMGGTAAFAQRGENTASPAASVGLQEVIVTARKRSEQVQNVPISITAFSGAALEERGVQTILDVTRFTPNLVFDRGTRSGGGNLTSAIFIRGVGQSDYSSNSEPGVGLYIDGVYFGRTFGSFMDAVDLDRIEILRGPQGTLFGKNTVGGAITLTSAMPTGELGGYLQAEVGRFNERNVKGSVDFPVGQQLAAKLSMSYRNRDGYTRSLLTGAEQDDVDNLVGRGILRWSPAESFAATTIVDGSRRREAGSSFHTAAVNPAAPLLALFNTVVAPTRPYGPLDGRWVSAGTDFNYAIDDPAMLSTGLPGTFTKLDGAGISETVTWSVTPTLTLTSISAYRDLHTQVAVADSDSTPLPLAGYFLEVDQNQFSQELRLNGTSFSERLTWVAGLYYFDERVRDFYANRVVPGLAAIGIDVTPDQHDRLHNRSAAAFLDATWAFTEAVRLTGGIRYNEDKKDFVGQEITVATGRVLVPPGSQLNPRFDSWTPKASLEYQPGEDMLLYASVAKGYKSGGINPVFFRPQDLKVFGPEEQTSYEMGVKSEWFERRLRANVAIFVSDYSGMQLRATLRPGQLTCPSDSTALCQTVVNAAENRIKGAELELTMRPAPGLDLFAGAGYLHNKFIAIDPVLLNATPPVLTFDRKLPKTPKWTVSAGAQYAVPLADYGTLTLRSDYYYRSEHFQDIENSPVIAQPGYGLLNARIAFATRSEAWEIALGADNLTDKRYISSGADSLASSGVAMVTNGAPRTWTASLKYRFDR